MARISDYTDYKTGTTSEEQSKLLETGKVVFAGKTTNNGDYQTKSVALSELVKSELPTRNASENRVLKARQSDDLVCEFMGNPLPFEYASAV